MMICKILTVLWSRLFLMVAILFSVSSCGDRDIAEPILPIPAGYSRLSITLPLGSTRASGNTEEGTTAENRIDLVNLFVFKDGVLEKSATGIQSFGAVTSPSVSILLKGAGERNAYLIANTNSKWLDAIIESGDEELFKSMFTDQLTAMATSPFIMSGSLIGVELAEGEQVNEEVEFERLVSRFEIMTLDADLQIESASFTNIAKQTPYFKSDPMPVLPNDLNTGEIAASGDGKVTLYSYDYISDEDPLFMQLKGKLDEQPIEYTIGLANADGTPRVFDRNNIYTVKVGKTPIEDGTLTFSISVKPWVLSADTIEVLLPNNADVKLQKYESKNNLTTFSTEEQLFETAASGDQLEWTLSAGNGVEITTDVDWITPVKSQSKSAKWELTVLANTTNANRQGIITIKGENTQKNYTLSQFDVNSDRYLVMVVAGQSNALGCDESPKYPGAGGMDAPTKGAYQLGLYNNNNLKVIDLKVSPEDVHNLQNSVDALGLRGTKGIHLPLAQLLLKEAPAGYNILVIPTAYSGSAFSTTTTTGYDAKAMRPSNMNVRGRWGVGQAYYLTMLDRTKYALNANPDNKLIGVVWCQGENDLVQATNNHFDAFSQMATSFFNEINSAGFGERCPRGKADKHIWYNYSTTPYFYHNTPVNPQGTGKMADSFRGTSLFGGYKIWNPDTFIHIPEDYNDTNYINGTGSTWIEKSGHFGNNAFRRVIAPLVFECIRENGGLVFDGSSPTESIRFTDQITRAQANAATGSLSELESGLMLYLPFNDENKLVKNMASAASKYNVTVTNVGMNITQATDLPLPQGGRRTANVLALSMWDDNYLNINIPQQTDASWTLSFILKRNNTSSAMVSLIKGAGGMTNKLFAGFRTYVNETCGKNVEFAIEPSYKGSIASCGTGRLLDADKVRSYDDWIYYAASFNKETRELTVYMNGELVYQMALDNISASNISQLILGGSNDGFMGVDGCMAEFYLWNRVLSPQEINKNYIMSYFGIKK